MNTERIILLKDSIQKTENVIKKLKENKLTNQDLAKINVLRKYLEIDEANLALEELKVQ